MTNPKIATASSDRYTYKLYVPSQRTYDVRHHLDTAIAAAGGCTIYLASGSWIAPSGDRINEPVDVYEFLATQDQAHTVRNHLRTVVKALLEAGEQEVLLVDSLPKVITTSFSLTNP